jgi:hypothetical protein
LCSAGRSRWQHCCWPLVWLLTCRSGWSGIVFDGLFSTLRALLFLPARLLGAGRSP